MALVMNKLVQLVVVDENEHLLITEGRQLHRFLEEPSLSLLEGDIACFVVFNFGEPDFCFSHRLFMFVL